MAATPTSVLAAAIASLDGYSGADVPQSYHIEAMEMMERLRANGYQIVAALNGQSLADSG